MPTNLPTRRRADETADRRTLMFLVAAVFALMGVALVEPAFTDTGAAAESSDLFSKTAAL
jgi:hypothetical protein